ncbi:MAG TPA: SRPBCC family protein [Terriglobales bacterium]|nr:SRPBCC family protein [Terriglobales bacterium]
MPVENKERIVKQIELKAPLARVWQAITDYRQFGEWFKVKLDGPFVEGQVSTGHITYPGYEYVRWEAHVVEMEPERVFSYTWSHPKSMDKANYSSDYSKDPKTLVEFRLEKSEKGTRLTLTESGFENIPAEWRAESFRRNDGGWTEQMKNIEKYVAQK